jgi:hypothetical protein
LTKTERSRLHHKIFVNNLIVVFIKYFRIYRGRQGVRRGSLKNSAIYVAHPDDLRRRSLHKILINYRKQKNSGSPLPQQGFIVLKTPNWRKLIVLNDHLGRFLQISSNLELNRCFPNPLLAHYIRWTLVGLLTQQFLVGIRTNHFDG